MKNFQLYLSKYLLSHFLFLNWLGQDLFLLDSVLKLIINTFQKKTLVNYFIKKPFRLLSTIYPVFLL